MKPSKTLIASSIALAFILQGCGSSTEEKTNTETPDTSTSTNIFALKFASVPTDGVTPTFEMGTTEVPYEVYAKFLTEAYAADLISIDEQTGIVTNSAGYKMTDINGYRVIKDHNEDGTYALDEMENLLNINFIGFEKSTGTFYVEDPADIDWDSYTNNSISGYESVVDSLADWFEFEGDENTFHGEGDTDGLMPTLDEVKIWPANFITYHGAQAFAEFYNYNLPTLAQWRLAAAGGENFEYSTSDGTIDSGIAWFNENGPSQGEPGEIHKGHVQPVNSKSPNPLGIYHMGGNVWEWVNDWYDGYEVFSMGKKTEDFFIDNTITFEESNNKYLKGLIGGSFNYFSQTMHKDWNHAAMPATGNDHFGFRVIKGSE